jgi:hypothetical protein
VGGMGHKLKPKEHLPMCCFLKKDLMVLVDLKIGSCRQLWPSFGKLFWESILGKYTSKLVYSKKLTTQGESNLNRHDGNRIHTLVKSIYL